MSNKHGPISCINKAQAIKLIARYTELKSLSKLSAETGYSITTLHRYLNRYGGNTRYDSASHRHSCIKIPLNEDYFEKIDSRDKAYILGIIFSDGTLYKNKRQVRIKLTDIDLLDQIRLKVHPNKKLTIHPPKGTYKPCGELIICNAKIAQDLMRIGLVLNKSYYNRLPNIDDKFFFDFLRGFFDGNGSISLDHRGNGRVTIISTVRLLKSVVNKLKSHGIVATIKHDKRVDRRVGCLTINRIDSVKSFARHIYTDISNELYLVRKYNRFKNLKHGVDI